MDQCPVALEIGKGEILTEGSDLAIIAIGATVYPALAAAQLLEKQGISATVINARFVKPLDSEMIIQAACRTGALLTVEENALAGGFGSAVLELLEAEGITGIKIKRIGIPDHFIEHGSQAQLRKDLGLDTDGIADAARTLLSRKEGLAAPFVRVK
jgi:1-deoxy-D-xylulose-5-phosphate synthase